MKQQEVIGGYDKTEYISERHFVKVTDGTLVPISLVYKKASRKTVKLLVCFMLTDLMD